MTPHTPTPWVARCNTIFNTGTNPALKIADIPNLHTYGKRLETDHDVEQANLQFIVTACNAHADLLAALEALVSAIEADEEDIPIEMTLHCLEHLDQARAALDAAVKGA